MIERPTTSPPTTPPSAAESARHLRLERDRHVAFAFAAADLLIEVRTDGQIAGAAGAAQAILGVAISALIGKSFLDFVAAPDLPLAKRLLRQVRTQFRIDPVVIELVRPDGSQSATLFGACSLPDRDDNVFATLTLVPASLAPVEQQRDAATGLLAPDALRATAHRLGSDGGTGHQFRVVQLDGLTGAAGRLPERQAALLMQEIGAALRAGSIGGDAASRLGEDAFGILTKAGGQTQDTALAADLVDAIREAGIPDGQVAPHIARINLSLGGLDDHDAGRALSYAMMSLVKALGTSPNITALRDGLSAAMQHAVNQLSDARRMLTEERLKLVFQPVVNLATRVVHHYEALTRLPDGADTFSTIVFSEDVGLIMDLDLIVCRQAIKALELSDASVAVNLSGRSVQNDAFRNALGRLLAPLGTTRRRLLFELTETAAVNDMGEAAAFLGALRSAGHAVCLDDFGSGAAAYGYLRRFDVDFLKIDGPFLRAARARGREHALIRSVCVLCQELSCKVIGEMLETEHAASLAAELGIGFGQGWLFGKPLDELPKLVRPVRRKGAVETWQ